MDRAGWRLPGLPSGGRSAATVGWLLTTAGLLLTLTARRAVLGLSRTQRWDDLLSLPGLALIGLGLLLHALGRGDRMRLAWACLGLLLLFAGERTMDPGAWQWPALLLAAGAAALILGLGTLTDPAPSAECGRGARLLLLLLLAGIVVLGGWLRLSRLADYPRGEINDEALNTVFVLELATGRPFEGTVQGKEPLFFLLGRLWFSLVEPSLLSLRRLAALAGVLTIPLVFALGRALFGARAGLLAALLLAVSPWHIAASRVAERFSLAMLLIAAAMLAWHAALRTGRRSLHLLGGLLLAMGWQTWATPKALVLLVALLLLGPGRGAALRRRWGSLLAAGLILVAGMLAPLLWSGTEAHYWRPAILGEVVAAKSVSSPGALAGNARALVLALLGGSPADNFYRPTMGLEPAYAIVFALGGLLLCAARPRRPEHWFLLAAIVSFALPALLAAEVFQRRMQGLLIPLALAGGLLLSRWLAALADTRTERLGLLLILGLLGLSGARTAETGLLALGGETSKLNELIAATGFQRQVIFSEGLVARPWAMVKSWELTRQPYSARWIQSPPLLPLMVAADRDVSLFLPPDLPDDGRYRIGRLYPSATGRRVYGPVKRLLGWAFEIPREDIAAAWFPGSAAERWTPGRGLIHKGRGYLPLDLRAAAVPWGRGEVWGLNLEAPFFGNRGNMRLDDLPHGLVEIGAAPFFLLNRAAVPLYSVFSPTPERTVRLVRVDLSDPWRARNLLVLGLISPWIEDPPTASGIVRLLHTDGSVEEIPLVARSWRFEDRPLRRTPHPRMLAVRTRDTYLDLVRIPVDRSTPIRAVEIEDANPRESLLIVAVTLEAWPAAAGDPRRLMVSGDQ